MSYPRRLLDNEGEATEFERQLLEAVRQEQPSAALSEQMLANTLAAGGLTSASLAPTAFITAGKGWALAAVAALGVAGASVALLKPSMLTQEPSTLTQGQTTLAQGPGSPHADPPATTASASSTELNGSSAPTAGPESQGSSHGAAEQFTPSPAGVPATPLAPPSTVSPSTVPPSTVPPSTTPPSSAAPQAGSPSPQTPSPPGTKAQQVNAPEAVSSLREEIKLLDQVRASLTAGDADGALASLAIYRQRFPRGTLQQESLLLQQRALDLAASSSSGTDRP